MRRGIPILLATLAVTGAAVGGGAAIASAAGATSTTSSTGTTGPTTPSSHPPRPHGNAAGSSHHCPNM
jgi:hypothetical protein